MKKLILLLPFLFSCSGLKNLECSGISGFKINKVSTDGINADVKVKIKNPNKINFKVYSSEAQLTYAGVSIGKAKLLKPLKIKKNSNEFYTCRLESDFKNMRLEDVMQLLEGFTRKGTLEVHGYVKVGKFLVRKKLPVSLREKISVETD